MKKKKKKNQLTPETKLLIKKTILFFSYVLILLLTYFTFSKNFVTLNFVQQFLGGPLLWIYTKLYNLNPSVSFLTAFFVGIFIFFPKISKSFSSMINFGKEFKNIMAIHKDETKTSEQRVNEMIDLMEEKNASLFSPFVNIFYSVVFGFTVSGISQNFYLLGNSKFLWFDLLGKDQFYILPVLITLVVIPLIIKNVKSLLKYESKMKTFLDISRLVAKITLVVGCYFSALTCVIFIISFGYLMARRLIKRYIEIKTQKV